jgi:mannose-6-phosphate isomerase-like protein (cupin superfamily)
VRIKRQEGRSPAKRDGAEGAHKKSEVKTNKRKVSMEYQPLNLREKLAMFSEQWSPKIVAQMNDYHFKIARVQGEFVWHDHPETDEVFLILSGQLEIHFRDGSVTLKEGEMFVVPKGVEHKPVAERECHILLVEPAGTVNTGEVVNERTAANDVWI